MQSTSSSQVRPRGVTIWLYLGLVVLLVALIGAGYLVFWQFAVVIMPRMADYNLVVLAIVAGIASFFSPCAFPLLPSYLAFYGTAAQNEPAAQAGAGRGRSTHSVGLGLAATTGVVSFSLILAAVIGLLGASTASAFSMTNPNPSSAVLWLRGIVGLVLVVLGVAQWLNVILKPRWVDAFAWRTRPQRDSTRGPALTLFLYGFGYTAAGIGCTGPILAGLAVFALGSGGLQAAATAFVVYAATMGSLMLVLSVLVAGSQNVLIQRLKANTARIKQVTSILLVAAGLFTLFTVFSRPSFVKTFFPPASPAAVEGGSAMVVAGVGSAEFTPPVRGIYEGGEVLFLHTEVSDPNIAQILTEMMGPQVIVVPELAETPESLLANVYVFANGSEGGGPLGFQPDVFDAVPGDENYRPLRAVNLVTWQTDSEVRLLSSENEIKAAIANGEISVEQPGIVANMPIIVWPGGQR